MSEAFVYVPRTDAENAEYIANIGRLYVRQEKMSKDEALLASARSFLETAKERKISEWWDIERVSAAIIDGSTELAGTGNVRAFARSTMGK